MNDLAAINNFNLVEASVRPDIPGLLPQEEARQFDFDSLAGREVHRTFGFHWIVSLLIFLSFSQVGFATDWYVAREAAGANNGTNWANAWTNGSAVVWASMSPGDTLWISGGTSSNVYDRFVVAVDNCTEASPFTVKAATNAPYNGAIFITNGIWIMRHWTTFDGSKGNDSWTNPPPRMLSSNINVHVSTRGGFGEQTVYVTQGTGIKLKWLEVYQRSTNDIRVETGGISSSVITGISFNCGSAGMEISNSTEVAYCHVHDIWGYAVDAVGFNVAAGKWGLLKVHHSWLERVHDNIGQCDGFTDIYNNVMGPHIYPKSGHPDGWQTIADSVRIFNNEIFDVQGVFIYGDWSFVGSGVNLYVFNNVCYRTPEYLAESAAFGLPAMQGMIELSYASFGGSDTMTMSNIWFANNTFINYGSARVLELNRGAHSTNGVIKDFHWLNNLITHSSNSPSLLYFTYTGDPIGSTGFDYTTNDLEFTGNIINSSGTDPNELGIRYGGNTYSNLTQFDLVHPWWTNYNGAPILICETNHNAELSGRDTVARGKGKDLSSVTALTNVCPQILRDKAGLLRPAGGWDVGAYQFDTNLVFRITFDNWSGTATALDESGLTNDAVAFGGTLAPTLTNSLNGSGAGRFYQTNGFCAGECSYCGTYLAVTNLYRMDFVTNGSLSVWAHYDTESCYASVILDGHYVADSINPYTWALGRYYSGTYDTVFWAVDGTATNKMRLGRFPDSTEFTAYDTGGWHHYAVTWDTNTVTSYFDGAVSWTTNNPLPYFRIGHTNVNPRHNLFVGCWDHNFTPQVDPGTDVGPNTGWMSGQVDDIRMYDRTISADEVKTIFADSGAFSSSSGSPSSPASSSTTNAQFSGYLKLDGQFQLK